jgi:hypothetical protein
MHSERLAEQTIIVRNLSSRGIGARAKGTLPMEGEEVFLQFNGREIVGRVRWVLGDRFGIHLRDPIDRDMLVSKESQPETPGFHVFDGFKPVERPWRPGLKG